MLAAALAAWLGLCGFDAFWRLPLAAVVRAASPRLFFTAGRRREPGFEIPRHRAALRFLLDLGVEIVGRGLFRVDFFMLSKMVDLRARACTRRIQGLDIFSALFTGYMTRFSGHGQGQAHLRPSMCFWAPVRYVCSSPAGIALRREILALFKPEYVEAAPVLACLMLTLPLIYINSLLANFAVAMSRVRMLFFVAVPMLAVNVSLNMGLIPRYGILGAALATLCGEILLGCVLLLALKPFRGKSPQAPEVLNGTV
jgi:hypothetical protein